MMELFLFMIFVKHYVVDFVLQTDDMVKGKGIYGNPDGLNHSLQHAIGTGVVSLICIAQPIYWIVLPLLDFVTHYHIDFIKMKYGERDITKKQFWNQLGLDQLAHYVTYLLMVII